MSRGRPPERGEVWWVDCEGGVGGEITKTRQAVVVSNDAANRALNRLQVVPLTSKIDRLYPSEAYVTLNGKQRKAMADQVTTAGKERLRQRLGRLSDADLLAIDRVLRLQLGL